MRRLRPSSTRRERPPCRVSLDTRPAASRAAALRRSRLGDMAKTVRRCAEKKVSSESPPVVWPGVGETRARRNSGIPHYAQSALLPRPSARALVGIPPCASFKKFTHTPLTSFSSMFFFVSPDHLGPTHARTHGVIRCVAMRTRSVTYFFCAATNRTSHMGHQLLGSRTRHSRMEPIGTTPTQATRGRSSSARARDRGRSWGSRSSPTRGSSTRRRLLGKKWPSVVGNRCELAEVKFFI